MLPVSSSLSSQTEVTVVLPQFELRMSHKFAITLLSFSFSAKLILSLQLHSVLLIKGKRKTPTQFLLLMRVLTK